jgi:hypothetical protein
MSARACATRYTLNISPAKLQPHSRPVNWASRRPLQRDELRRRRARGAARVGRIRAEVTWTLCTLSRTLSVCQRSLGPASRGDAHCLALSTVRLSENPCGAKRSLCGEVGGDPPTRCRQNIQAEETGGATMPALRWGQAPRGRRVSRDIDMIERSGSGRTAKARRRPA